MTVRRRQCRAFDCPRHVDRRVLFCNVHWDQLLPRYQAPIRDNLEAPAGATPTMQGIVLGGVVNAQAFLAKKEGKASAQLQAARRAASDPQLAAGVIGGVSDNSGNQRVPRMPREDVPR